MKTTPSLSLILPTYNAAPYIIENLGKVLTALTRLDDPFEVLVVCDGCTDNTAALAAQAGDDRIRVITYPWNRGKGYAICAGVSEARGDLIGWLDADLDIDPGVIVAAVERFTQADLDAVVGSKRHPQSRVNYPLVRRGLSACFQLIVLMLFKINVRDTQVGAKVFRREMLTTIAPLLLVKRYAFDLEVLAVGAEFGFDRIEEAPIALDYQFRGSGITQRAVWNMFQDVLALAYRIHIRHWYPRQFASYQYMRSAAGPDLDGGLATPPTTMWSEIASGRDE